MFSFLIRVYLNQNLSPKKSKKEYKTKKKEGDKRQNEENLREKGFKTIFLL